MPPFFIYYHLYNNACHDQYQTQNRKHGNLFSQNKMCQNQRHKRNQICQIGNHRCISQIHLFFQDPAGKKNDQRWPEFIYHKCCLCFETCCPKKQKIIIKNTPSDPISIIRMLLCIDECLPVNLNFILHSFCFFHTCSLSLDHCTAQTFSSRTRTA